MAELVKPLYIMVVDDVETTTKMREKEKERGSFRYTRSTLQSTLQLMGCKPRHAFKISQRALELIRGEASTEGLLQEATPPTSSDASAGSLTGKLEADCRLASDEDGKDDPVPFQQYKKRTTVVVRRATFLNVVCKALAEYKYVGPNQRADLVLACRIRERKESVTVLLCGTSGCGKSTLSSLLGSRLGITTVISTDSIRHMMRSFASEKENSLLWASTYHAGECLDPEAVAEAKAKKKAKKLAGVSRSSSGTTTEKSDGTLSNSNKTEIISPKQMAVEGFKAQSEMVIDSLDRLITAWEERKESVVVEGVHLSLNFVMGIMKKHPSIIPFMIYIANEEKHMERFAVRAKYMTLHPSRNKYVKYIRNIRAIQEYLCKGADKHLVPKINNTNVDKSVAAIHATVFSCLRRRATGEQLYDPNTNTVTVVDEEYRNQCTANSLSSKGVFQLIQRKGSSRNLMALLNTDGTVAKTWVVDAVNTNGDLTVSKGTGSNIGDANYGPMQIGKAEPVNLRFGHYGISAWPDDGATSHSGSYDEPGAEWTDASSRHYSSRGNSPRLSEGPSKELKEDNSVDASDEEVDDAPEANSDFSDDDNVDMQQQEEVGSVDESTKSDEEYEDLAMLDIQESGYWSGNNDSKDEPTPLAGVQLTDMHTDKSYKYLDSSARKEEEQVPEPLCLQSSLLDGNENIIRLCGDLKSGRRGQSIPVVGKHGTLFNEPIISGGLPR